MLDDQHQEWVARSATGDEAAFEQLYASFAGRLYSYFRVRLDNEDSVQDVLQETFVALWRSSGQFHHRSTVATWVFGIARHKLMKFLREKYRMPSHESMTDEDLEGLSFGDDFTEWIATEDTVQKALKRLSPESRELIHLVFVQELSYGEISRILEIPPGTVKSRMYNLRLKLQQELQTRR